MKKMLWMVLLAFGFSTLANSAVCFAASPKIGYFDLTAVLNQSRPGKQAQDDFSREKDKIKAEMDEKAKAFKTARDEFDRKKTSMDEATKKRKTQEIMEMQQEGEKLVMESNAKLNRLSSELMTPIVDKIIEIVRKMGRDDKYDYIIEAGKGGIVYANDKEELTKRVVTELDRNPPAPKHQ